ncbi:hypothetical protein Tco_0871612 [Tanacetum coccineum]
MDYFISVHPRSNSWWKPITEDRPATPEPAWSIPSSDLTVPTNNWASALKSTYTPPPENSLLAQISDMATFMDCASPVLNGRMPQTSHQSSERCNPKVQRQQTTTVGWPALSISKMKAAYYPDVGLEQMVPDQMWIDEECKHDVAAMYGITHWWFQRQRFYIDRHTSEESMANAEQAPARASPVRTDEQIVPRNRWVPIGKSNCYLDEEKSQRSPIAESPVLQILWGIVNRAHIDYAERVWEEFTQSIHTFTEDKRKLAQHTLGKKKATHILIPNISSVDAFVDEGVPAATPSLEDSRKAIMQQGARKGKEKVESTKNQETSSLYAELGLSGSDTESDEERPSEGRSGNQDGGQAGLDHGTLDKAGWINPVHEKKPCWIKPCVLAGPNLELSDVEITGSQVALIKRMGELEQHIADLVEENQALESRLEKTGAGSASLETMELGPT